MFQLAISFLLFLSFTAAKQWPYNRYQGEQQESGRFKANASLPEFEVHPDDLFVDWLRKVIENGIGVDMRHSFVNKSIPTHITSIDDLVSELALPASPSPKSRPLSRNLSSVSNSSQLEAEELLENLGFPLDPRCTVDRSRWYYRTHDGSCNWLKQHETEVGAAGTAKPRDYNQHFYADGIAKPRDGPNPRAVSNAFFRRKKTIRYEHTPLLLGLVEFLVHDITYSQDSTTEFVDVMMPEDEPDFPKNTTLRVWRTESVPGTGTSKSTPRENVNMVSTWMDVSSLYGSTEEVARSLRSYSGGELLSQEVQSRGTKSKASYLPFNFMGVPLRTRPGMNPKDLFAGGDLRTNEDWMVLGVHTLMLREHNRLCKILAKQHPEYDDERLYQTVRLVLSAKFMLIANSYQMAYWTDEMPWPRDDGFPLYRQMYGANALEINAANVYPWPLVTKGGKPMVVSAEMAVVYRFHEFIISSFPIKDAANNTLWEQNLFTTGFNASGFVDAGLENILRGMVGMRIPTFKSGVDESFRTAGRYKGQPFDIVTWSIVHEREQGLPTFNAYFREYNNQDPAVEVPIRKRFEDFSTDSEVVANLKKLYSKPDDVDLVVGVQLDEEYFPGTIVPKSALIISLFSLFGMGNSDRFSVGYAMMRCLLVDKPWDCHPSNALEELLWKRKDVPGFPDFRFYDDFWVKELDFQAHGTNLLWRLVTENSEVKCLQKSPLFVADPVTNPVLCVMPETQTRLVEMALMVVQVVLSFIKLNYQEIMASAVALIATVFIVRSFGKH